MKRTEQKVIRFISENNLLKEGEKILIALSGGPDSVFLLHFLNKYKNKFKVELGVAHINHLLRGKNSDRDELFCKTVSNELNIPFYSIRKNVKSFSIKNKVSIEVAARKVRYHFFESVIDKFGYDKLLTAHNSDDNVETVLLNLIKGAGLKGIAGIPVKRDFIIRPIICLTKKEILEYLDENKFEFRIDESNLENDFERNFLRNEIIPLFKQRLNPSLSNKILTTSLNLQKLVNQIDKITNKIKSVIRVKQNSYIRIPIDLLNEDEILLSYSIKQIIEECFNAKMESSDIKKIFSMGNRQSGSSEELSNKLMLYSERDEIEIIKRKASAKKIEIQIRIGEVKKIGNQSLSIKKIKYDKIKLSNSKTLEFISAENIKSKFTIRNWTEGDKFYPIGMIGTKKISNYLNDIKISSFEKKKQLILENDGKIVWVIGQRLDDRFKIKPDTKKVLQLCLN